MYTFELISKIIGYHFQMNTDAHRLNYYYTNLFWDNLKFSAKKWNSMEICLLNSNYGSMIIRNKFIKYLNSDVKTKFGIKCSRQHSIKWLKRV